jgi:hypothetical protein
MGFLVEHLLQLWDWLKALPADFAFLLSLPFLVALAGVLAELGRGRKKEP